MSEKDDFWKDLMGDDYKDIVDDFKASSDKGIKPTTPDADNDGVKIYGEENSGIKKQENQEPNPGFTVEYVNKSGETIDKKELNDSLPDDPLKELRKPPITENNSKSAKKGHSYREVNLSEELTGPKDFEVDFDFEHEYADVNEKSVRRGRNKRTGCLGGILFFLFVICISVVLAMLGWIAATDVLGFGDENKVVEVEINKAWFSDAEIESKDDNGKTVTKTVTVADIDKVSDMLYENGIIKYKWLFKLYSSFSHADRKIKAGTYELNLNYDYYAIVNGMTSSGGQRVTIDITIPEGYTITQIVKLLDDKGVCDKNELLDALKNYDFDYDFLSDDTLGDPKRLEGYLFPDTYTFYVGDTASRVIKKLLNNFENKWTKEYSAKAEEMGYSISDIITIASMIEKEAGGDSERSAIASVIYNRLNNPGTQGTVGLLQVDATIYYVIEDTGEEFSTEIDSPYNTYLYAGLPAGPISNPGVASIRAALYPDETSYYYYALGKNHLHEFFKTYDGFVNFVNSDKYGG